MSQYKSPESNLDLEALEETYEPNLALRILCWLLSIISFIVCFLIGQGHNVGTILYSIGHGISVVLISSIVLLPFLMFRYFRKPNPKRVVYLVLVVLLTFFMVVGQVSA